MKSASPIETLDQLALHTITTKPWPIAVAATRYAAAGVKGITVWRQALAGHDPQQVGEMLRALDLTVVALCREGFFASAASDERQAAIHRNLAAIDEASALGAPLLVMVCGADPRQSLQKSRMQIKTGLETVLEHAESVGVRLAIEPLHPMYADSRSAINTLKQANDLVEAIGSSDLGVAVDVYHVWWDSELEEQIHRAGEMNALFAFHLCDWKTPEDLLNDRALMGDGCIPLRQIRSWMESAGFNGFHEVEIFSNRWWASDQDQFLEKIIAAYRTHC